MHTTCPHCIELLEIDFAALEQLAGASHFECPHCTGAVPVPAADGDPEPSMQFTPPILTVACLHCSQAIALDRETLEALRVVSHFSCPTCDGAVPVPIEAPPRLAMTSVKARLLEVLLRTYRGLNLS